MKRIPLTIVALTIVVWVFAILILLHSWSRHVVADATWFLTATLVGFASGAWRVRLSRETTISLGYVIVFSTLLHLGTPEACVVAALNGLAAVAFPYRKQPQHPLAGLLAIAYLVLCAWIAGNIFDLAKGGAGSPGFPQLFTATFLAVAIYHFANAVLVASIAAISSNRPFTALFTECYSAIAGAYCAGGGLALLVHLASATVGVWALITVVPVLYDLQLALFSKGAIYADKLNSTPEPASSTR
ncbi:MAG: hypothetical protein ACUVX8_12835 [Candidatus Zipacnadales bacterium]